MAASTSLLWLLLACGKTTDILLPVAGSDTGRTTSTGDLDLDGYSPDDGDCDDDDPDIHPGASERCDGIDNDCDGNTDESDATDAISWYRDYDGDGFGDPDSTTDACDAPPGYVGNPEDCDDTSELASPIGEEVCNDGLDNDCDGDESACYLDGTVQLPEVSAGLTGAEAGARTGHVVSGAGDTDGDGLGELLIGAPYADDRGTGSGVAYLLKGPVSGALSATDAHATLQGTSAGHAAGTALAAAGDVDDDGYGDVLIGAITANGGGTDSGEAYLLLGPFSGTSLLADADAKLIGEISSDGAGFALAGPGDVDGDGTPDLLVGATGWGDGGLESRGATYLISGAVTGSFDLSDATARVAGATAYDSSGSALAGGDLNGDGLADVVIGVPGWSNRDDDGAAMVLYGPLSGSVAIENAEASYRGTAAARVGEALSIGDLNGDGHLDLAVGAPEADGDGAAVLFLGPIEGALSEPEITVVGERSDDGAGRQLGIDGDLNGDGLIDLMVAAAGAADGAGEVGVFYGPVSGSMDLGDADVSVKGADDGDGAGTAADWAPDVNGDGHDDLLIGAPGVDSGATDAGAAYLVLGEGG